MGSTNPSHTRAGSRQSGSGASIQEHPPAARRGPSARGAPHARRSLFDRLGREFVDHPAETAALVTMAVAFSRLLPWRQAHPASDVPTRRRALLPLSMMAALCIIGLSACATGDDRIVTVAPGLDSYGREYPEDFATAGRKIALDQCASCHAIDQHNVSPNRASPPLNTLLSRYDPDRLADDLIAGTWVGHEGMPRFDFNVIAADSLIAYLETIDKDRGER